MKHRIIIGSTAISLIIGKIINFSPLISAAYFVTWCFALLGVIGTLAVLFLNDNIDWNESLDNYTEKMRKHKKDIESMQRLFLLKSSMRS